METERTTGTVWDCELEQRVTPNRHEGTFWIDRNVPKLEAGDHCTIYKFTKSHRTVP